MEKINKELEEKIITLVGQNKIVEAVSLVQKELELGLKESKDIVDTYQTSIFSTKLIPELSKHRVEWTSREKQEPAKWITGAGREQ